MSEIIKKLKQLKKKNSYTYDDLSRIFGINSMTIARWFRTNKINKVIEKMILEKMEKL